MSQLRRKRTCGTPTRGSGSDHLSLLCTAAMGLMPGSSPIKVLFRADTMLALARGGYAATRVDQPFRLRGGVAVAARGQQAERMRRIGKHCPQPRTIRYFRPASGCSCKRWRYWAGPSAQPAHRNPLGHCQCRRNSPTGGGVGRVAPDVILATGNSTLPPLMWYRPDRADCVPVAVHPVAPLRRQLGSAGRQRHRIYLVRYGTSGKWLELLKEIAPGVTRAAVADVNRSAL